VLNFPVLLMLIFSGNCVFKIISDELLDVVEFLCVGDDQFSCEGCGQFLQVDYNGVVGE
jgi:hypothetical protein